MCTDAPCTNIKQYKHGIGMTQPDRKTMTTTYTSLIDLSHLPMIVRKVHIFPDLSNKTLLSLGHLCDNGYSIQLTVTNIHTIHHKDSSLSLKGIQDKETGMWLINLKPTITQPTDTSNRHINNVYERSKQNNIVQCLCRSAYSPVLHMDKIHRLQIFCNLVRLNSISS